VEEAVETVCKAVSRAEMVEKTIQEQRGRENKITIDGGQNR
jgi:hypothetical protein